MQAFWVCRRVRCAHAVTSGPRQVAGEDAPIPEKVFEALLHTVGLGGEMASPCLTAIARMAQKPNNIGSTWWLS